MLFNSLSFLIFLPIFLCAYWLLPTQKLRVCLIVLGSLFFYAYSQPSLCILLLITALINYIGGILIGGMSSICKKKWTLAIAISLDVLILCYFKYFNFFITTINSFAPGHQLSTLDIILPLGISFYLFKGISYLVDVYRVKIVPERNVIDFIAYYSFFPQIIAGPIDRACYFLPQIKKKKDFDGNFISSGAKLMLWGFFLKVVFANRASIYVDAVYNNLGHHNGTTILLAAILYSIQIYCDFAGYSLISIGCAKAMGIDVRDNFNRPYFAHSITEFWGRWHISLTSWLKEYIYIPLGGSHDTKFRTYLNILVVFLISGLWHGAAWTFVFWGVINGVFQVIERMAGVARKQSTHLIVRVLQIMFTFLITTLAWMFFRLPSIEAAFYALQKIFTTFGSPFVSGDATTAMEFCLISIVIIFIKQFFDEYYPEKVKLFNNPHVWIRYASYIALTIFILLAGVFDDSQFIYAQF